MKTSLLILLALFISNISFAQTEADLAAVKKTCLGYIEGFYQGDTLKLINNVKPTLHKFGYWKNDKTGEYGEPIYMTFDGAKEYANEVLEKKNFPKADAPKKIEILDIIDHIASVKVTAWWGVDYILLSKQNDNWMIEQVLWQGPLKK